MLLFLILSVETILISCSQSQKTPNKIKSITINVTGDNYNWIFRYPGQDGLMGNSDDFFSKQNLYLPNNSLVTLHIESKDYLYSFGLPDYGLKQIAVPGLNHKLSFNTNTAGTTRLIGDQFCGFSHESLKGTVHIVDQNVDFYEWQKNL